MFLISLEGINTGLLAVPSDSGIPAAIGQGGDQRVREEVIGCAHPPGTHVDRPPRPPRSLCSGRTVPGTLPRRSSCHSALNGSDPVGLGVQFAPGSTGDLGPEPAAARAQGLQSGDSGCEHRLRVTAAWGVFVNPTA